MIMKEKKITLPPQCESSSHVLRVSCAMLEEKVTRSASAFHKDAMTTAVFERAAK